MVSGCGFLTGTCFKVSDWCALSAIVCLQMTFVTKICFLSLRAPFSVGKLGALFIPPIRTSEQKLLSAPTEGFLIHHLARLSLFASLQNTLSFPVLWKFCCIFFFLAALFDQPGRVSLAFTSPIIPPPPGLLPSPSSRQLFSVRDAALRPLQAQLRLARVLLSLDSHQQRLFCHTYL